MSTAEEGLGRVGAPKLDPKVLELIRKTAPQIFAEEILSVQPMDNAVKAYGELYEMLKDGKSLVMVSGKNE